MTAISILDLIPINTGSTLAQTYDNSVKLAQHAESCGYNRYWLAEHHNMPGIGSSATTLLMSHLAANTSSIRIGSGGIMLPNHSPLTVAEQFGTLETLYPGRIDLGLGRAPGADGVTLRALRRSSETSADQFLSDVLEILDYFEDNGRQPVRAVPGAGQNIPVWILGSSTYGASLAAHLGLPYAFASHFAPRLIKEALQVYRSQFRPSHYLEKPHVMAGINVFAADTRSEAEFIASSHRKWLAGVHTGRITLLPEPVEGYMQSISSSLRQSLERELAFTAIGAQDDVRSTLMEFIDLTGADELMIDARIYDPVARRKSYEIAARALGNQLS